MAEHRPICCRIKFDLEITFEVLTTPYQGSASSIVEVATLRLAAFRVNRSKRVEWRP